MIEHGEIKSESDTSEEDQMSPLKDYSDIEYPVDKQTLVIRRSLNVQIK